MNICILYVYIFIKTFLCKYLLFFLHVIAVDARQSFIQMIYK